MYYMMYYLVSIPIMYGDQAIFATILLSKLNNLTYLLQLLYLTTKKLMDLYYFKIFCVIGIKIST